MAFDHAISEIIGAIALMGIIVAAFGIFSAIYLPMIKPTQIPQVKLTVACNQSVHPSDTEFPCTQGSFSCHPIADSFDNKTCEKDCKLQGYLKDIQYQTGDLSTEVLKCMEHCVAPMCSNLIQCNVIYVCHNGGDSLDLNNMNIFVNGININRNTWEKKNLANDVFMAYTPINNKFRIGESLRIQNPLVPVDKIMITYDLSSGNNITLVLNQFGTDVD